MDVNPKNIKATSIPAPNRLTQGRMAATFIQPDSITFDMGQDATQVVLPLPPLSLDPIPADRPGLRG